MSLTFTSKIKKIIKSIIGTDLILNGIRTGNDEIKILLGTILANGILKGTIANNLSESEFKVFSQFGDDGIIQYLIKNTIIDNKVFIEFGVQDYSESNTRFLLIHDNWKGLVIDCDQHNINYISQDEIYWKHDITAVCSFITRENINEIFSENYITGEIGLLSIDIDGNDYWVWDSINVINPVIVIVEYNSVFGNSSTITVPYDPYFNRTKAHYSNLYWGCSLGALYKLADKKGYCFIGCNSNGNNAYFIRKDKIGGLKPASLEEGYVESKFRESRNEKGELNFLPGAKRIKEIENLIVYDINKDQYRAIKDL